MHYIFISYAGENHLIAKKFEEAINTQLSKDFCAELVEDRKEGDTTFTEKIIKYFKKCNIFIVLLTKEALQNQFVNQEWGYAKCLKEFGQIQILLHIIEKNLFGKRIKSAGFISTNMDFIDINKKINGKYKYKETIREIISFLESKEDDLIPIFPESLEKLNRFLKEIDKNIALKTELIENENSYRTKLYMNPINFHFDYALQILQVGHLFPKIIAEMIELYINKIKEINVWKGIAIDWAISRGEHHELNTNKFYKILTKSNEIFNDMRQLTKDQISKIQ